MLFQNIIQSDNKRLIKEIIEYQIRAPYGDCWVKGILEICHKFNFILDNIRTMNKIEFKKEVKKRINNHIEQELEEKKKVMKKLRFIDGVRNNQYLKDLRTQEALIILKTRVNMLDLKANFRGKYSNELCELCKSEEDSTEHLFSCRKLKELVKSEVSVENLRAPSKELSEYINQAMLIKNYVRLDGVGYKAKNRSLLK